MSMHMSIHTSVCTAMHVSIHTGQPRRTGRGCDTSYYTRFELAGSDTWNQTLVNLSTHFLHMCLYTSQYARRFLAKGGTEWSGFEPSGPYTTPNTCLCAHFCTIVYTGWGICSSWVFGAVRRGPHGHSSPARLQLGTIDVVGIPKFCTHGI